MSYEGGTGTAPTAASLAGLAMFAGVDDGALRELIAAARRRTLDPGEVLIEGGARLAAMFVVLDGELGVHLEWPDGERFATIGAGETVGEISVLDGSGATAWVVAQSACALLELPEEAFWRLTRASHAFAVNLLVKLAARLRDNNRAVTQNAERGRMYQRAAMVDALTGVHSRRWLDETLPRLLWREDGTARPFSVALLDIDHFKGFNDRFGHAAGDQVLGVVAATLVASVRPTDFVARFGGEEFAILFPDTGLESAARAAERLRLAVAARDLGVFDGVALPQVTISLGVAELAPGMSGRELLKRADAAMYRAKEGGRNQVALAPRASSGRAGGVS